MVQLDAETDDLPIPSQLREDDRVRLEANGEPLGIEPTRNLGLLRARGRYVQNLDHDDHLLEAGFDVTAAALDESPELAFAFGDALDLLPDGSTEPNEDNAPIAPGRIEPGALFDLWERCGTVPLHNSGVIWRADVLRAYGGWAAVPGSGDTAAIMAVAEDHPCLYLGVPTVVYRRHAEQTVESPTFVAHQERNWECARMRVRATRALRRS